MTQGLDWIQNKRQRRHHIEGSCAQGPVQSMSCEMISDRLINYHS